MKKKVVLPLVAALVVGAAAFWWWNGHGTRAPAERAVTGAGERPVVVTLATARQQDVPVDLQVNGSVVALSSVELRPQVSNTVRTVHVKEGQFVKEGELLFSLDDRADQANLAKARAQQLRDEATQTDLERQYRRSQDLLKQNFISKSAADATLSQLEAQRAAVAADRAAVQAAQVALGYASLRAPIAGRIGQVAVYPGSLVTPTATLLTITQLDPIAVSFPVPEAQLQYLLAAARARAKVEAVVPGREPVAGVLDFVDNQVDPQIGTVRAKALFDNAQHQLWPGQFVETRLTVRTLLGATVIPAAAVMKLTEGDSVYVVQPGDIAQRRRIRALHNFGAQVAVEGVQPGERVVLEGKQNVRDGGKVSAAPEAGATGAPGSAAGVTPASVHERGDAKAPARSRV